MTRMISSLLVATASVLGLVASGLAQTTQPAVDPGAVKLIEQVKGAYEQLAALKAQGKLSADLDVGGRAQQRSVAFTAEYQAPGKYRHAVKDEVVAGSTGQKVYVHELARNVYLTQDAPEKEVPYRQLPGMMGELLEMQDPAILLAVSESSIQDVIEDAKRVKKAADTQVDGQALPTLAYQASDGREVQLAFGQKDYLLRRATYDLSELMRSRGAEAVNKALVTIDYEALQAGAEFPADHFAWSAPANAREVGDEDAAGNGHGAAVLQGKAAPDFTLKMLDGKELALSSLKGSPVLLDFWATWCPPCVRALPEINELHHALKDKGVKVYAVNVGEDKAKVQKFLTDKKLDLPVLLDSDSKVTEKYGIRGIPTTVLIKPDGTVHKVFVGMPPGGKAELERELQAAK